MVEYKIVGNSCSHGFRKGQIVFLCDPPAELPDGAKMYFCPKKHWAWYCAPKDVIEYNPSSIVRLYRGIMGAMFGPESHSVNRYADIDEKR